jgi:hypothetical protein
MQLLKCTKEWKIGIRLIPRERKMISLKYLKLGKGRKKTKWLMNTSAIDNQHSEICQNREPMRLEKVGAGKLRIKPQFREWGFSWNKVKQMSERGRVHTSSCHMEYFQHIHGACSLKAKLTSQVIRRK